MPQSNLFLNRPSQLIQIWMQYVWNPLFQKGLRRLSQYFLIIFIREADQTDKVRKRGAHRKQGTHALFSVHFKRKILIIDDERMLRFWIRYGNLFSTAMMVSNECISINGDNQVPTLHREFNDHIMHESKPNPVIHHHSLSVQGNKNARPYLGIHRPIGTHCR